MSGICPNPLQCVALHEIRSEIAQVNSRLAMEMAQINSKLTSLTASMQVMLQCSQNNSMSTDLTCLPRSNQSVYESNFIEQMPNDNLEWSTTNDNDIQSSITLKQENISDDPMNCADDYSQIMSSVTAEPHQVNDMQTAYSLASEETKNTPTPSTQELQIENSVFTISSNFAAPVETNEFPNQPSTSTQQPHHNPPYHAPHSPLFPSQGDFHQLLSSVKNVEAYLSNGANSSNGFYSVDPIDSNRRIYQIFPELSDVSLKAFGRKIRVDFLAEKFCGPKNRAKLMVALIKDVCTDEELFDATLAGANGKRKLPDLKVKWAMKVLFNKIPLMKGEKPQTAWGIVRNAVDTSLRQRTIRLRRKPEQNGSI